MTTSLPDHTPRWNTILGIAPNADVNAETVIACVVVADVPARLIRRRDPAGIGASSPVGGAWISSSKVSC